MTFFIFLMVGITIFTMFKINCVRRSSAAIAVDTQYNSILNQMDESSLVF